MELHRQVSQWADSPDEMMRYEGYSSTNIELDVASGTIHGRVDLSRGMATFEGETAVEAIQAFRDSVDDYLTMCATHGIEPEQPAERLSEAAVDRC